MKKLNFLAIVFSLMLMASCGEQKQNDQNYDASDPATEAPSDVYQEGDAIDQEEDMMDETDSLNPEMNETPMEMEGNDLANDTTTVE